MENRTSYIKDVNERRIENRFPAGEKDKEKEDEKGEERRT